MPEAEKLTVVVKYSDGDGVISEGSLVIPTGQNTALTALQKEYDTLANLKWRAMIKYTIQDAAEKVADMEDEDEIKAIVGETKQTIIDFVGGEKIPKEDYIVVSFSGNTVRVPEGISQEDAFRDVMEQVFPREKGYWYLDMYGGWMNGYGGRMFTEGELESGFLEKDIQTPSKTFKAGEALPRSGVVAAAKQLGGLQYLVNGFYANYGVRLWKCAYGDQFTWGPYEDDGIPDFGQAGCEPWSLAPGFTEDANVTNTLSAIDALTDSSSANDIEAAREAYNEIPATFWNPLYARYLFQFYEPYKTAYDKLANLEKGAGIVAPPPTVTAGDALADTLDYISQSTSGLGATRRQARRRGDAEVRATAKGGQTSA
jgi:hypothetical protein